MDYVHSFLYAIFKIPASPLLLEATFTSLCAAPHPAGEEQGEDLPGWLAKLQGRIWVGRVGSKPGRALNSSHASFSNRKAVASDVSSLEVDFLSSLLDACGVGGKDRLRHGDHWDTQPSHRASSFTGPFSCPSWRQRVVSSTKATAVPEVQSVQNSAKFPHP